MRSQGQLRIMLSLIMDLGSLWMGISCEHIVVSCCKLYRVIVQWPNSFRLLRSLQDTARIIEDSSYFLLYKSRKDYKPNDEMMTMVQYVSIHSGHSVQSSSISWLHFVSIRMRREKAKIVFLLRKFLPLKDPNRGTDFVFYVLGYIYINYAC